MRKAALSVFSKPSPRIRAVMLDGAGTLFDHRCNALLGLFGSIATRKTGRAVNPEVLRAPIGLGKFQHFRGIYLAMNLEALDCDRLARESVLEMDARFSTEVASAALIEGAAEAIRQLQKGGIQVGINSSYSAEILAKALAVHGLEHLPWVTPEQVERGRPYPDMLRYLAQKMQVKPEETLVLGDTAPDVQAARASGAWSAIVTDSSAFARGDSQEAFNAVMGMLERVDVYPHFTVDDVTNALELVDTVNDLMGLGETPASFRKQLCHVHPQLEKPPLVYNSNWHR